MDDETILAVATGRKCLLGKVMKTLADNLNSDSVAQHMLIRGPRGMGKSFFLKYLQITFRQSGKFDNCEFLLLPEEQNNINTPSDLIKLILSELTQQSGVDATTYWDEPDEVWQIELQKLKKYLSEKKSAQKDYMLVVVLENLDTFLRNIQSDKKTAKVSESRFRHLLEKLKDLTIIGAVPRVDSDIIDGNYNKRLFHAFKKCTLKKWTTEDYFKYFDRRKDLSRIQMTAAEESLKRAKLRALSHFTGGSPRIAVVLTNLLLEDDVISTANTLFGLIDDLTPYYQDLTKSIPKKSKILFDTLIRKGENLSQSELAETVGATQNKISKAFLWLKDNGYVVGKKRSDSSAFSYQVADRIHVLYYQLREINHNQGITPIWLLSDFLVAFYQSDELRTHAFKALLEQPSANANDLAKLSLISSGLFYEEDLPELQTSDEWLQFLQNIPEDNSEFKQLFEEIEIYFEKENRDNSFREFKIKFNELISFFEKIDKAEILSIYIWRIAKLTWIFLYSEPKSNFCLFSFNSLLSFIPKIGNDLTYGIIHFGIGNVHAKRLDFESAESHISTAVDIFDKSGYNGHKSQAELSLEELRIAQEIHTISKSYNDYASNGGEDTNLFQSLSFVEKNYPYPQSFAWGVFLVDLMDLQHEDNMSGGINYLIVNWLKSGVSKKLIKDICEEGIRKFTNKDADVKLIFESGLHAIHYLESNKSLAYLEKLPPDTAIAIKAIVEEANL